MKYNRFVVCDEFGPIRAFSDKKEAEGYLQHLLDCDVDAEMLIKPKPEKPDLSYLGEPPF